MKERLGLMIVVLVSASLMAGSSYAQGPADPCLTPLVEGQPICNPAVADSEWPISHSADYAQGSSAFPGPLPSQTIVAEHVNLPGPPITLAMSPRYADGGVAVWGSVLGLSNAVVKIDHDNFTVIDIYVPADEEVSPPPIPLGVSGAYSVADPDFNFVLGRAQFVEVFRDSMAGDRSSEIELAKRVFLPPGIFCRTSDLLVGGVMLPDGMLAFATEQAVVGVIPAEISQMEAANVIALPSENGADCVDGGIDDEDLETVSNSIAADENGGIYMVTDAAVIKYQWDGSTLQKVWRADYDSDPPFSVLRLGPGSGSTPSLMGTAVDDDRFVVITDGQKIMNLVLMWRDDIPAGWQPIAPGKDPRIACEVPINFGNPSASRSLSEQSVLVRGNAAIVVNNLLRSEAGLSNPIPAISTAFAALEGGNPSVAPAGAERVDWDPATQTCVKVWANTSVSLPNAIPTMSATTEKMYAIGQRSGVWGLETLNFATGASEGFAPSALSACPQEVLDTVAASVLGPVLIPRLTRLPASCENSFFAATEVGPDGTIYTGTFQGASKFTPDAVATFPPRRAAVAGVEQGIDLVARGLAGVAAVDVETVRDAVKRGQIQAAVTLPEIAGADVDASLDTDSATAAAASVGAAETHFAAAEAAVDSDLGLAQTEINAALDDLNVGLDYLTPCPPAPQSGCRLADTSGIKVKVDGTRSRLSWKWSSTSAIDPATIPDPQARSGFGLCLYEDAGTPRSAGLLMAVDANAWKPTRNGLGYRYNDKTASSDGLRKALIREKLGSKATVRVSGKGANLPTVGLPLTSTVTVQLVHGETASCWSAEFEAADVKRNEAGLFRAKANSGS